MKIEVHLDPVVDALADEIIKRLQLRQLKPRLLSIEDTSLFLGRSEAATRKMIQRGTIPSVRLDGRVMIDVMDLEDIIQTHKD